MFALTMFALNYCEKITEECPLFLKCSLLEEKNVCKGEKKIRKCLHGKKTRNQNNILLTKTTDVFYAQQGAFGNHQKELY